MAERSRTSEGNVPWLTNVPQHWQVVRAKRLFRARTQKALPGDEQLSATQAYGVIPQTEFERREGRRVVHILQNLEMRRHVEPDDFVISMRSFQGGLERAWARGCIRSSYVVLAPTPEVHVGYFSHLFKSYPYIKALQATSNFIRDGQDLNFNNFCLVDLPLPPMEDQRAIARFLDHADRRIRRYIRAKQKLIKLLEEQKQAIIHQAVTRGLDPTVRMNPSGVECLGEVPEHWAVTRVKAEFDCVNNRRVPLSGTERGRMSLRRYDYYGASGVIDKVDDYLFDENLLLIAEDGANLVLRNLPLAIIARGRYWVNNHAHILRPRGGNIDYLACLMESLSYRPWITGAAQPKLTKDRLFAMPIVVAPRHEQDVIMDWINAVIGPAQEALGRTKRELDLVREFRLRLVSEVVTGKVDVRAAAAALPDESDDPGDLAVDDDVTDDEDLDPAAEETTE